jgi:hypothetical protein
MPRAIDVEKSRPGARRELRLGAKSPWDWKRNRRPRGNPPPPPGLPPIAAKADDLEAIKRAVDDAASVGGGLWLSYLFVLFYLAGAAGAVTHADLFLEKAVKLPFLSVELPLLAFFFLAPILFLIVHAYTLVHLVMLTEKAKRYHQTLQDPERSISYARREKLQWQLPSNIFIQFLAGPAEVRESLFGWALRAIAWITLVIAPILLLLMMQIQFLPFHSLFVTWTQRIALVVDLVLIWWLWGKIWSGREVDRPRRRWAHRSWLGGGLALSFAVVWISLVVVTFPGEWQEDHWSKWRGSPQPTKPGSRLKYHCTTGCSTPRSIPSRGVAGFPSPAPLSLLASISTKASASMIRRRLSGGISSSVPADGI